jgi:hypothetical protein
LSRPIRELRPPVRMEAASGSDARLETRRSGVQPSSSWAGA